MSYKENIINLNGLDTFGLDMRAKVGQVVMPRLDFRKPGYLESARRMVVDYGVGGFIIFGGDGKTVRETLRELDSLSAIPLLFGCDAERGLGQIVSGMGQFPYAMSLGAAADEELVYKEALCVAEEMADCGFNLNFAPVLDVNTNPGNPIINIRSYGDDPGLVARLGSAFIKGLRDGGILSCGKHFPGHGSAGVDSHSDLPVLDLGPGELKRFHLSPFEAAVEAGVDMIMTAHVAFPGISGGTIPATISGEIINGILRAGLGYGGVVITDSYYMSGISKLGDEPGLSLLALSAGCDIILDPRDPHALLGRLNDMALTGGLKDGVLNSAAGRVLSLKKSRLGEPVKHREKGLPDGRQISELIARRSVCLLKGVKMGPGRALVCSFDITNQDKDISTPFAARLREAGLDYEILPVTAGADIDELVMLAGGDVTLICLVYTGVGAWKNQYAIPDFFRSALERLAGISKRSALFTFGSPYVVRGLDNFDTIICAFDSLRECQSAAADVLLGVSEATGRIPVAI